MGNSIYTDGVLEYVFHDADDFGFGIFNSINVTADVEQFQVTLGG